MIPIAALFSVGAIAMTTFRLLHTFISGFPSTGSLPAGTLIADAQGVLYGTTQVGGRSEFSYGGTVYALTPTGGGHFAYRVLHYFTGDDHPSLDGSQPASGVTADAAGNLYGTTVYGGAASGSGSGTVFTLQRTGAKFSERVLYRFTGGVDGSSPAAAPLIDAAGSLYGTTAAGGQGTCQIAGPGCGTVYELQHSGTSFQKRILYRFKGGTDGATPQAPLIADAQGALYGTTQYGGVACPDAPLGCGTVFKLTPVANGYRETILYRFTGGATDGVAPLAGLVADSGGNLYGTTDTGGSGICAAGLFKYPSCGTIFMLHPTGTGYVETVLHNFIGGAGDGYRPESALVPGGDGLLYGTTFEGGAGTCYTYAGYSFGCGTVYSVSPIGGVTLVESFGPGATGYAPGGVFINRSGQLFGTTGGNWSGSGAGTVFELTK